jgi:stage III sporulation protein AH
MKNVKRNVVIVTVLLFVCAAVYLNWSYNNKWGVANDAMVDAEDEAMAAAEESYMQNLASDVQTGADSDVVSDYFASARLTRQQSRDEALALLQTAAAAETASQETIDSAMNSIAVMATYSMQESQIENQLIAKDFADCVVFMTDEGVTVAVPAPAEGLSEAAVARITDTITTESGYAATQLRIIEVKSNVSGTDSDSGTDVGNTGVDAGTGANADTGADLDVKAE